MKVLINPKIIINEPVQGKRYGFKITLSKKDSEQLTVKAFSHCGRNRGAVGKITKTGETITLNKAIPFPAISQITQMKIDILLDFIYGKRRDKTVQICKGLVYFNK